MTTKQCTLCAEIKLASEFNNRQASKDGLSRSCKQCHRDTSNKWYGQNKARVLTRTRSAKKICVENVRTYKEQAGCKFCEETYHRCLQFHHLDPTQKDFNVSERTNYGSWEFLLREIKKCVVVCGNCHIKVHDGLLRV